MYDSILVGTDGSDDASAAVRDAVSLARALEVPLYGVAVVETRTAYDTGLVDPEEAEERLRARAQDSLEALERAASDAGVSVTTSVRSGPPHEEILAYADERDVGLVVVGSHGRSSFRRALLGSTVDAILRLSERPVLVVDDEDAAAGDSS
ncbi:universal stress protein [Halostagnicola kamekurae]|uniref:Nucleotide-binding universal stress protein, UspA family n=1 Tax=Halostagnicola kamekurae TaxID=619731 RepID=A0A1I6SF67_9EURY|nr:universal stress protein [Halostagnicola kamekurae]SFS75573.1 Nucleotide-binding universal stress protein, UspA family [Halostagnicola kamekurae]